MTDSAKILNEMIKDFREEADKIEKQIQNNLLYIKESEVYVKTLTESESEDYKVFSPRRAEVVYRDEIDKISKRKSYSEKLNQELSRKQEILRNYIKNLEMIVNQKDHNCRILYAQEEERKRIARDLHDTSLQNLTLLIHKLELSSMYIDQDPVQAKSELYSASECLRKIIEEIRYIIYNLHPIDLNHSEFKAAVKSLFTAFNEKGKYKIDFKMDNFKCDNEIILISIYRIIQESLYNIEKHAGADRILFHCMKKENKCILLIKDNGKGISEKQDDGKKHFGISLMKEKVEMLNGKIDISSNSEKGTKIYVEIPLKEVLK